MGFGRIAGLLLSAVGVRLAGAVIGFVLQIILARWLSPAEMGGWFLMVSLASFAGLAVNMIPGITRDSHHTPRFAAEGTLRHGCPSGWTVDSSGDFLPLASTPFWSAVSFICPVAAEISASRCCSVRIDRPIPFR